MQVEGPQGTPCSHASEMKSAGRHDDGGDMKANALDSLRVLHNDMVQSRELKLKQKAAHRLYANQQNIDNSDTDSPFVVRLLNVWVLLDGTMEPLGVVPCNKPYHKHNQASKEKLDSSTVRVVLVDMPRFAVLLFDTEKV